MRGGDACVALEEGNMFTEPGRGRRTTQGVSTPHPHHSRPYGTSVPFSLLLPDFLQVDVSRATLVESLYLILLLCLSISYSMIEVAQATFREEAEP